ncbi:hypothetical protein BR93DRAFT_972635 [Coniochaeta sp. PMI_546]|nr:hypothetical protein BR93DRAFT_972635 [Coniochaeta sp. PMI_546]
MGALGSSAIPMSVDNLLPNPTSPSDAPRNEQESSGTEVCQPAKEEVEDEGTLRPDSPHYHPASLVLPCCAFTFTFSLPWVDYSSLAAEQHRQSCQPRELSVDGIADDDSSDSDAPDSSDYVEPSSNAAGLDETTSRSELEERVFDWMSRSSISHLNTSWLSFEDLSLNCDDDEGTRADDEQSEGAGESCADIFSADDSREYLPIQHLEHRDSLDLTRERIRKSKEEAIVDLLIGSDDEDEDEWYDAAVGPVREGSNDDTSSAGSIDDTSLSEDNFDASCTSEGDLADPPSSESSINGTRFSTDGIDRRDFQYPLLSPDTTADDPFGPLNSNPTSPTSSLIPFPPFDPGQGVPHPVFSPTILRYAGGLGNVSPYPTPSPPHTGADIPSLTLTPATPRTAISPEDRFRERWPGYRYPGRIDTGRLFVRESDRDLRRRERMLAGVRDRWAVVRRRRQRFQDALREKVGGLEAWRRAQRDTKAWADWAWSGP